jgi:hypothetical protein
METSASAAGPVLPAPDRSAAVELWNEYLVSQPDLHGAPELPPV